MPDYPSLLVALSCRYCRFDSPVCRPVLMISGQFLLCFLVLLEDDEISGYIEKPAPFTYSPEEDLNLGQPFPWLFSVDCLPLHEPLSFRGDGSCPCFYAVTDDQNLVVSEKGRELVGVRL